MSEPNPDDPLNNEAATEWKSNKKQAEKKAQEWTVKYAKGWATDVFLYINLQAQKHI